MSTALTIIAVCLAIYIALVVLTYAGSLYFLYRLHNPQRKIKFRFPRIKLPVFKIPTFRRPQKQERATGTDVAFSFEAFEPTSLPVAEDLLKLIERNQCPTRDRLALQLTQPSPRFSQLALIY